MDVPIVRSLARRLAAGAITVMAIGSTALSAPIAGSSFAIRPMIDDFAYLGDSVTPPSQAACNAFGRRCFSPAAMATSYNYAVLHALGNKGQGKTIVIVDSFGASTIRHDLESSIPRSGFRTFVARPDHRHLTATARPAPDRVSTSSLSREARHPFRLRRIMGPARRITTSGISKSPLTSNGPMRRRRWPISCSSPRRQLRRWASRGSSR